MIQANLNRIYETIKETAMRVGRDPADIKLVAVSKNVDPDMIAEASACGQPLFGENYLQEAAAKIPSCPSNARWHFIGHLQSNKARQAVELFECIETVDSLKLAKALDKYAQMMQKPLSIFIQVNIGKEPQKSGIMPEEVLPFLRLAGIETNLKPHGLMTMPPYDPDPERSRPFFRQLREIFESARRQHLFADESRAELSMGMSGDFPVAIEEGATIIRVGTALFGQRI